MPITPTGKNKMKPNLRSYFSQTSLSQPQNRARQMHWDAGSSPNSVSLVLRSSIKGERKDRFSLDTGKFLEPKGSWEHWSHILSNLPAHLYQFTAFTPALFNMTVLRSHTGRTQVKNGQDAWESTWPETWRTGAVWATGRTMSRQQQWQSSREQTKPRVLRPNGAASVEGQSSSPWAPVGSKLSALRNQTPSPLLIRMLIILYQVPLLYWHRCFC